MKILLVLTLFISSTFCTASQDCSRISVQDAFNNHVAIVHVQSIFSKMSVDEFVNNFMIKRNISSFQEMSPEIKQEYKSAWIEYIEKKESSIFILSTTLKGNNIDKYLFVDNAEGMDFDEGNEYILFLNLDKNNKWIQDGCYYIDFENRSTNGLIGYSFGDIVKELVIHSISNKR